MTPSQLEELEKLAEKATAGPWREERWDDDAFMSVDGIKSIDGKIIVCTGCNDENCPSSKSASSDDADFIAAANPQVVLEMIEEIRELRMENKALGIAFDKATINDVHTGVASEHPPVDEPKISYEN